MGRYYCLVKGRWEAGLPLLVKGSDAELRDLAAKDLSDSSELSAQVSVADGWRAIAERERDKMAKSRLAERAIYWYGKALPSLTGLSRLRVERAMEGLTKLTSGSGVPRAGLVFWVEPGRSLSDPFRDLAGGARADVTRVTPSRSGPPSLVFARRRGSLVKYPASLAARNVSRQGTVVLWMNTDDYGQYGCLFARYAGRTSDISIFAEKGRITVRFNYSPGNERKTPSQGVPAPGKWVHCAVAWDAKQVRVYLDGKADSTFPLPGGSPNTNGTLITLGSDPPTDPQYLSGRIGSAMLYARALTPGEVRRLHDMGRATFR